jgi:hypothetical protein
MCHGDRYDVIGPRDSKQTLCITQMRGFGVAACAFNFPTTL